jgi:hypothetical protein
MSKLAMSKQTCEDVWNVKAVGPSCGSRILWLQNSYAFNEVAAKLRVALEHPVECGSCAIDLKGNRYEKNEVSAGAWGGMCTCPNGQQYEVLTHSPKTSL